MSPLPTGTLTLLFSDIEGSTSLLKGLGPRWGDALSAQRRILREAFAAHQGVEMGTEGDSFFVVFTSAQEALAAAIEAQRRLGGHDWPGGTALRVRIGLHTGEPQRHEDGYIGIDVHRAARIAATSGRVRRSAPTVGACSRRRWCRTPGIGRTRALLGTVTSMSRSLHPLRPAASSAVAPSRAACLPDSHSACHQRARPASA